MDPEVERLRETAGPPAEPEDDLTVGGGSQANTFNTPGQSRNTPGLRVSQIKATTQAELLVQYVTDVTACKCLHSAPEVEKCS